MVSLSREREALILANLDLVDELSRRTTDPEEFYSIGQLALVLAAGRHDLSRPQEAFRAYAAKAVQGAINNEYSKRESQRVLLNRWFYGDTQPWKKRIVCCVCQKAFSVPPKYENRRFCTKKCAARHAADSSVG